MTSDVEENLKCIHIVFTIPKNVSCSPKCWGHLTCFTIFVKHNHNCSFPGKLDPEIWTAFKFRNTIIYKNSFLSSGIQYVLIADFPGLSKILYCLFLDIADSSGILVSKPFFTITERILMRWLVESYGLWEYRPWKWVDMSCSTGCFDFGFS